MFQVIHHPCATQRASRVYQGGAEGTLVQVGGCINTNLTLKFRPNTEDTGVGPESRIAETANSRL